MTRAVAAAVAGGRPAVAGGAGAGRAAGVRDLHLGVHRDAEGGGGAARGGGELCRAGAARAYRAGGRGRGCRAYARWRFDVSVSELCWCRWLAGRVVVVGGRGRAGPGLAGLMAAAAGSTLREGGAGASGGAGRAGAAAGRAGAGLRWWWRGEALAGLAGGLAGAGAGVGGWSTRTGRPRRRSVCGSTVARASWRRRCGADRVAGRQHPGVRAGRVAGPGAGRGGGGAVRGRGAAGARVPGPGRG